MNIMINVYENWPTKFLKGYTIYVTKRGYTYTLAKHENSFMPFIIYLA